MGLEQTLNDTLTKAMKEKDARTADVIRMIKSKIGERRTAKGFSGTIDDALVLDVLLPGPSGWDVLRTLRR